jgi:hypothetical protein
MHGAGHHATIDQICLLQYNRAQAGTPYASGVPLQVREAKPHQDWDPRQS